MTALPLCYTIAMHHLPLASFMRRTPPALILLICLALPWMLTGCAAISQAEKAEQVSATLDEADRQFSLSHDKEGLTWCDKAIALMPHSPIPYVGDNSPDELSDAPTLIAVLTAHGKYPELAAYLSKAASDPKTAGNWQILQALGDAQYRLGEFSDSKATYAKVLAAIVKVKGTAGASLNSLLQMAKANAEWYSGDQAQSQRDYQDIITTDKDNAPNAENNLAYDMALSKVNLPQALILSAKAVDDARAADNDSALGTFLDTQAWVEHQMGKDSDAVFHAQEAVSLVPSIPDVHYHLAEIYRALGQRGEAQIEYQQAIGLDPSYKDAQAGLAAVKTPA